MYYPTGSSHSIIPAAPDWALASFDTGTEGLIFQPVIAWFLVTRVGEYSARATHEPKVEKLVSVEVYPITADGLEDEFSGLRQPDGTFDMPNLRTGMSEAEYLEELKIKVSNPGGGG
jgi:hypothetical protein